MYNQSIIRYKYGRSDVSLFIAINTTMIINPHMPVPQKVADEVVLRHFPGEGVEFFLIGHH